MPHHSRSSAQCLAKVYSWYGDATGHRRFTPPIYLVAPAWAALRSGRIDDDAELMIYLVGEIQMRRRTLELTDPRWAPRAREMIRVMAEFEPLVRPALFGAALRRGEGGQDTWVSPTPAHVVAAYLGCSPHDQAYPATVLCAKHGRR